MVARRRWWLIVLLALTLPACSRGEPLPPADRLLADASRAMADVRTLQFRLDVDGLLAPLPIKKASGVLTREGEVSATLGVSVGDRLVESRFVLAEGKAYFKGPTGPFVTLPPGRIYDPSRFLDPQSGLGFLLGQAREGRTEEVEKIEGTRTYRVRAEIPTELLEGLTRLAPGQDRVTATLWIEMGKSRLIRAEVPFRTRGDTQDTVATLTFSEFNAPATIKPPKV